MTRVGYQTMRNMMAYEDEGLVFTGAVELGSIRGAGVRELEAEGFAIVVFCDTYPSAYKCFLTEAGRKAFFVLTEQMAILDRL